MKLLGAALLAILLVLTASAGDMNRTVDMAEFGPVEVLAPGSGARGFVIAFSGGDSAAADERDAIRALGAAGLAVAVIDSAQALRHLGRAGPSGACVDLVGPLEWLSTNVERDLGWSDYRPPLLVGQGVGGSLVYAALGQAAPQAFAGGVSVDFRREIALATSLCRLRTEPNREGRQELPPNLPLAAPWFVGSTVAMPSAAAAFVGRVHGAAGVAAPAIVAPDALPAIYSHTAATLIDAPVHSDPASIADLPLVEVSAATTIDTLAIVYSGDGGWRDIDKHLGDVLAARGVAVVGVDSLRYFWSEKTPEQAGADLARIIEHYSKAWHVRHVVLIGYSFGADILSFAYNRVPPALQGAVTQISLIAAARAADFEIRALGWLGAGPSDAAQPIPPESMRIGGAKLQCIYGVDDARESLCTDPAAPGMEVIARPGGHHFNNDYDTLARVVLAGICRRSAVCRG